MGDRILVAQNAPVLPSAAAPFGFPLAVTDSAGNAYTNLWGSFWEKSPPNVNEGVVQYWWISDPSQAPLVAGVGTITATWDNPVYDRSINAWLVRKDGGAPVPTILDGTPDGSPAVFAANQITLQSPAYTPSRDNTLFLATITVAKAGGVGGFGGVPGWSGYLQVMGRTFNGSKQSYMMNQQTFGANALLVNTFGQPAYEIDLGQLPAGVLVPAFNGVAQLYTSGTSAYKGILIFAID